MTLSEIETLELAREAAEARISELESEVERLGTDLDSSYQYVGKLEVAEARLAELIDAAGLLCAELDMVGSCAESTFNNLLDILIACRSPETGLTEG